MSEYWKSTPRYWCKHCACYVRDTKLERKNHESTAKHQGAIQRTLRNMHKEHEREEREKEQARKEIARLNGIVPSRGGSTFVAAAPQPQQPRPREATEAERQRQREQLAEMGVSMPETVRSDMAMAGEWTVTSSRVIGGDEDQGEAKAKGVHKREATLDEEGRELEGDEEEEEAVRRLFKKPRRWGKGSGLAHGEDEDGELDALLSGTVIVLKKDDVYKKEEKNEEAGIKTEEGPVMGSALSDRAGPAASDRAEPATIKEEDKLGAVKKEEEEEVDSVEEAPDARLEKPVIFRKRKTKGIRPGIRS
ncbi:hypothetical protein CDD80_2647 [Ophiocordyceps camponoti-rufipedis]|uniref:U1-C C2H2-type zinc finger domain-containing protein n=1 Tax=Ophiocordyceps camponoti-rufipedis TaxID=2004952 RepID=A0A2C5Z5S9_9HYPO|nr:hypothetical protein CDD80_2647 [Ophiocordyceps camponoti-rufipedis]